MYGYTITHGVGVLGNTCFHEAYSWTCSFSAAWSPVICGFDFETRSLKVKDGALSTKECLLGCFGTMRCKNHPLLDVDLIANFLTRLPSVSRGFYICWLCSLRIACSPFYSCRSSARSKTTFDMSKAFLARQRSKMPRPPILDELDMGRARLV